MIIYLQGYTEYLKKEELKKRRRNMLKRLYREQRDTMMVNMYQGSLVKHQNG